MDRVLGRTAGNAVEVRESIDHLTGAASDPRLLEVTLGAVRAAAAPEGARRRPARRARVGRRGRGLRAHGGGPRRPRGPARAPRRVPAGRAGDRRGAPGAPGVVAGIDVRAVGLAVIDLGGGRRREDDAIDHAVGLTEVAAPGERVGPQGQRRWRSSTPATRTRPPAPPRRWRPPSASATACSTRTRRCWRSFRDRRDPQGRAARPPRGHRAARPRAPHRAAQRARVPEGVFAAPIASRGATSWTS